jgi:HEAT repeat protein
MHFTVGRAVDDDFATFKNVILDDRAFSVVRNMALGCVGFSVARRQQARELLLQCLDADPPWFVANAAFGLSVLRDKETDLTKLIRLLGHGDQEVRTSAGTALKEIFMVRPTPRELTPEYWAAVDGLISLMHDEQHPRARRAGVTALANLHHPAVLEHLCAALKDDDEQVQIYALIGLEALGDQRALDPLCDFLDGHPTESPQSYAKRALIAIAVQGGFAKTPAEVDALGTSGKAWRKWFRNARNR